LRREIVSARADADAAQSMADAAKSHVTALCLALDEVERDAIARGDITDSVAAVAQRDKLARRNGGGALRVRRPFRGGRGREHARVADAPRAPFRADEGPEEARAHDERAVREAKHRPSCELGGAERTQQAPSPARGFFKRLRGILYGARKESLPRLTEQVLR
jgi:hypothetical protein